MHDLRQSVRPLLCATPLSEILQIVEMRLVAADQDTGSAWIRQRISAYDEHNIPGTHLETVQPGHGLIRRLHFSSCRVYRSTIV